MSEELFEDIKIVGFDEHLTRPSSSAPGLRNLFLRLSARPSEDWESLFNIRRRFPRHSMWRKAWIEDSHIIVACVPEELEVHHLPYLKEDVADTNQKYRQHINQEQSRMIAQKAAQEKADSEEKQRLNDIKSRLKFE